MFQTIFLRSFPPVLLFVLILLSSTTCSELSERDCEFTRSEVAEWRMGYPFKAYLERDFSGVLAIESIELGPGGTFLSINDICTTAPLTVSAELSLAIKEGYPVYDRAYLIFRHKLGNTNSYLRSVALARTSLGEEGYVKLEVHPFEYSALPLFSPEGAPGSLTLSIAVVIDAPCDDESDANSISEYWLNLFFRNAKITVDYTVL